MAIATATVWEVRTGGADTNGGGYSTGGTDYSQQNAAQIALTDLATTSASSTITSASALFTSAMVGNVCYITGGTGPVTTQRRQIITFNSSTSVVLDTQIGQTGTGATCNVGGAVASPGAAASAHVGGNTIYVGTGTYTITSASTNVNAGCVSLTLGTAAADTRLIGYNTARGDNPTGSTRPLLQASGFSGATAVTLVAGAVHFGVDFIQVDGASLTTNMKGFSNTSGTLYRCKALNCTLGGIVGGSTAQCFLCEATGCSTTAAFTTGNGYGCVAWANSIAGFGAGFWDRCVSVNNTTANGHGFNSTGGAMQCNDCTAYGNAGDGFHFTATAAVVVSLACCVSVGNTGAGIGAPSSLDLARVFNCATQGNTGAGVSNIPAASQYGTVTLGAAPFTNAAGGDFSLNSNNPGGAQLRAAGVLGAFPPGITTTGFADVGAVQHADPTSTTVVVPVCQPIFIGRGQPGATAY